MDGQTVTVDYRFAEERYERLPNLAEDLVRVGVDVIFATTGVAAAAAQQATQKIPIVFNGVADPVASRFAASLGRPGGNMTGFTHPGPQTTGKLLGFLTEAVPKLARVAVLRNPTASPSHPLHVAGAEKAAHTLRLRSQVFDAGGGQDFDRVFVAITRSRAQGILVLPDSMFYIQREKLAELALRHRLPMIANRAEFARSGALMAFGSILSAEWRRVGALVARILDGARPGAIPIEEPSRLELVINLKTAKALGLTIPPSLLQRADQVIE